ncbi:MAG TPA: Spy/CpxP family protein refolding chaperone [Dissulfurispiraceae bacterium]|nr:Spy/CpxP family protein refolding chaperone [Dissulfurispiraceae bacterium]
MKKSIIAGTMAVILAVGGAFAAQERVAPGVCGAGQPCEKRDGQAFVEHRMDRMAIVLGLSDAQQTQIKTILQAEREKNAPLRRQMADVRKELHGAMKAPTVDEAKIKGLAARQGQLKGELLVAHAHTRTQISGILTPEQREKAEKLRATMKHGPRGPHHRFGG